ncbi:hypothetical protein V6N13_141015 [Hibiscus sabdariffa]|uniref:Benzyl alcohol O-benzoyltransferase-like n=1 Tax=Hibiscus sabdariffa TaxID=183260 RepID=A0ABR2Q163_9ROSI
MATPSDIPLSFTVRRCKPEFITPNKPTSHEQKLVSDIDNQMNLRFHLPLVFFYRYDPSMEGKDPGEVIKDALAQTLVLYYPFAGRLREGNDGKLIVDCNDEGVMFIKADADVTLEQFGGILRPPFPCFDQLLCDFPHSQALLNCPPLLIQVTRLKCGGFIVALRFNHVMCDGTGLKQFMSAIGEMARGLVIPSILPVWERHLLDAQDPPKVAFAHHEYDQAEATATLLLDDVVERSFFFGADELSILRRLLPRHLGHCTKFELLTAYLWRCRTIAMDLDPDEEVRMLFAVNVRSKFNPQLPSGYYGNALVSPAAMTTVRNLRQNPLGHAVELVQEAKASVTEGYVKSVAALMSIRKKQVPFSTVAAGSYAISDLTNIGFQDIDFGWGKAVFAGPANAFGFASFFIPTKNNKGQVGTSVPICLPAPAMERFTKVLGNVLETSEIKGE